MTLAPTVPARSLDDVLDGLRWHMLDARQARLPLGTGMRLAAGDASLVYVREGQLDIRPEGSDARSLRAGGLALIAGAVAIRALEDAAAVVAGVETLGVPAARRALPRALWVPAFDASEPVIAQLAAGLGCPAERASRPSRTDRVICTHIATTVLSAALRSWSRSGAESAEWPAASADPQLSRVLDAIHEDLARDWTLSELASVGAMSRSVFAARFRATLGTSPRAYLTSARIAAAQRHLLEERLSVGATSRLLGYRSEEGFSRAFRKQLGVSPTAWRDERRTTG